MNHRWKVILHRIVWPIHCSDHEYPYKCSTISAGFIVIEICVIAL